MSHLLAAGEAGVRGDVEAGAGGRQRGARAGRARSSLHGNMTTAQAIQLLTGSKADTWFALQSGRVLCKASHCMLG